jgi:hypothetical protein
MSRRVLTVVVTLVEAGTVGAATITATAGNDTLRDVRVSTRGRRKPESGVQVEACS